MSHIFMSFLPCQLRWRLLPIKIRSRCTTYSFVPPATRYRRSPPILSTWAPRSAFSACCTPGARPSRRTLTQYARHYHLLDFSVNKASWSSAQPPCRISLPVWWRCSIMLRMGSAPKSLQRISQGARGVTCSRFNRPASTSLSIVR
jgi:hypothetical protein